MFRQKLKRIITMALSATIFLNCLNVGALTSYASSENIEIYTSGNPKNGETITFKVYGDSNNILTDLSDYTIQWKKAVDNGNVGWIYNNATDIDGATGTSYQLSGLDAGNAVYPVLTNISTGTKYTPEGTNIKLVSDYGYSFALNSTGSEVGDVITAIMSTETTATNNQNMYVWFIIKDGVRTILQSGSSNTYTIKLGDYGYIGCYTNHPYYSTEAESDNLIMANSNVALDNLTSVYISGKTGSYNVGDKLKIDYIAAEKEGNITNIDTSKFDVQWYRKIDTYNSEAISGANNITYTLTSEDFGKEIYVQVDAKDNSGYTGSKTSNKITPNNYSFVLLGESEVDAGTTINAELTKNGSSTSGNYIFWFREKDGISSQITYGLNQLSYSTSSSDEEYYIYATVTLNGEDIQSNKVKVNKIQKSISLTGNNTVGSVLSATGTGFTWPTIIKWYADDELVKTEGDGMSKLSFPQTYTVLDSDAGKTITCKIEESSEIITSNGITISSSSETQEASVSLSGTGKVGEVLTATVENGNLVDDGMGVSIKWLYEDGTEATTSTGDTTWTMLSGAPTIQYTVKEADAGKKIYCKIIGMSTIESNTIEIEAQEASVSLSGTGKIGEVLTATVENGNLVDDGMGVSVKWLYEDETEATTSTGDTTWTMLSGTPTIQYTVKEADAGKKIHCKIIGMSNIQSNTIEIEAPVKQQNISLTIPSVIYAGNSSYGTDVWLRNLYNDDYTSGTIVTSVLKLYDYQWYLDDQPVGDMITSITSFTNIKYRVYQSDIGKTLKLKATAKDGSGEGWSNEASIVDVTSTVEIVGTPKVGETLTASPTPEYTDNDLNKGYTAWFIDGVRVTDYIYTRTGKDFVVPEGTEAGSKIKVLTFINDLGTYIESPEVTVLASDTDTPETPSTIRIPDSIENVKYQDVDTTEAFNRTVTEGDVLVYVSQGQNFIVKLPKRIVMDGSKAASTVDFNTMVTANISGYDIIHVEPEADSLKLKESTGVKKDIDCNLSIGQTLFSVKDDTQEALEAGKVANHSASVTNLSAGSWRGTFNWHISVDGKLYSNSQENVE